MKFFALVILFSFTNLVSGQQIPHTVEILDAVTTPNFSHRPTQYLESAEGVYLLHSTWHDETNKIISIFDGETNRELFRSTTNLEILGNTSNGIYVIGSSDFGARNYSLLFVNLNGEVDTLISEDTRIPETYQFEDQMLIFSTDENILIK